MGNQNSINQVILVGRMAREVELKTAPAGRTTREFARFTVITNEFYKDYKQNTVINKVEYHTVVAWGARAKFISNYGTKGKLLCVIGKLRHSKFANKEGDTKYTTEVHAEEITYFGPKGEKLMPERLKKDTDESEEYREKPF